MTLPETPQPAFDAARADYLREARRPMNRLARILATALYRLWRAFPGHLSLLAAVGLTVPGCVLLVLLTAPKAKGVDVPDRVIAAICQVETGTRWHAIGDVRGTYSRGGIGEVGPWQLAPSVLRDLKAYDRRDRIHACPVLAESLTRAWLAHLYRSTGNWPEAVAAYHAGLAGRHRGYARSYAERVMSLAAAL